jgi:putative MFS transporter
LKTQFDQSGVGGSAKSRTRGEFDHAPGLAQSTGTIGARINRMPITRIHLPMIITLSMIFLFELADLNTFGYAAPGLMKYWNLSVNSIGIIVSASFLGMFIGAWIGGWFSDLVGRQKALILFTLFYSIMSLLNAFTTTTFELELVRLLTGIGMQAMSITGLTYVSEMFPRDHRGRYQSLILAVGLIGIPLVAWFARVVVPMGPDGWRWVFVLGSLGIVLVFLIPKYVPESPRWLEIKGRNQEAESILTHLENRIEAYQGRSLPQLEHFEPVSITSKVPLTELFSPNLRKRTIVLSLTWIFIILGFYGFGAWVPTLLVQHGYSVVKSLTYSSIISLGAVPGALLAWPITDRFGRKQSLLVIQIIIAICVILYGLAFNEATVIIFGFLSAMLLQTLTALLYAYSPEIFPTRIRSLGVGFTGGLGRLGNVVGGVVVAGIFNMFGYLSVFLYIASMFLIPGILMGVFGERTAKRSLEDISK